MTFFQSSTLKCDKQSSISIIFSITWLSGFYQGIKYFRDKKQKCRIENILNRLTESALTFSNSLNLAIRFSRIHSVIEYFIRGEKNDLASPTSRQSPIILLSGSLFNLQCNPDLENRISVNKHFIFLFLQSKICRVLQKNPCLHSAV